jgi:GrpB-like predicted nucleotidyltransferase (UPF0157 family)
VSIDTTDARRDSRRVLEIVPHRPEWVDHFAEARAELLEAFAGADARIEHVGSTSVPGLAAKPIIDICVGLDDLAEAEIRVDDMLRFGYHYVPEYEDQIPDRRYFRKPAGHPRTHHVHCLRVDGVEWGRHLLFRDTLRERPDLRAEYGALKTELAKVHAGNRDAYTEAKSSFIQRVLLGLTTLALALLPCVTEAQTPGTYVGVVGGWISNEQIWQPDATTEKVGGVLLGGFLNAVTPASWFSIQAEAYWAQRGGNVTTLIGRVTVDGGVRSDYLAVSVHPRATVGVGPVGLFIAGGPTVEQIIQSRLDPTLGPVLTESATTFGVNAGVGVSARINPRLRGEVELRVFEGLGDAYSGDFVALHNRSFEVLARVGIPLPR